MKTTGMFYNIRVHSKHFKKNLEASETSMYPPSERRALNSNRLGGNIVGCKKNIYILNTHGFRNFSNKKSTVLF